MPALTYLQKMDAFCEAAGLHRNDWPYAERRKDGQEYGNVLIAHKGHDFKGDWKTWWEDFIGLEVFCLLEFRTCPYTKKRYLNEVHPVRLTKTKIIKGRSISSQAILLI